MKFNYDALGRSAILNLLGQEYALVGPEIEARLADSSHHTYPSGVDHVDPHHLTNARRQLMSTGLIQQVTQKTRGGGNITVITFSAAEIARRRCKTDTDKAAQRKRLLQARYLSWTRASGHEPNMVGVGGERVAHASLVEAVQGPTGYILASPTGNEVTQLFGQPVPGGPIDSVVYLTVLDNQGMPVPLVVLIEVKNIRDWVYPTAAELFQLLDKAAQLQVTYPAQRFVPLLICRRAHYSTFLMARALGFLVRDIRLQPILPHSAVDPAALAEVVQGLGYDLVQTADPQPLLVNTFRETIPNNGLRFADRWARTAPHLSNFYSRLRQSNLPAAVRAQVMDQLRQTAVRLPNVTGGW